MNFNREKEVNKNMNEQQKLALERERLQTQRVVEDKKLANFCKEKGLIPSKMSLVHSGHRRWHKGWSKV